MKKLFRINRYFLIGCFIFALAFAIKTAAFSATEVRAQQVCTLVEDEYPQCGGTCNGISYPDNHTIYVYKRVNEWDCEYYWECNNMGPINGQCDNFEEQPTPTPVPYYEPTPTPVPYYPPQPTPTPHYEPTPTPVPHYPQPTPTPVPHYEPTPTPVSYYHPTPTPYYYYNPTPTPYYPYYPQPTPYYPYYPQPTPYYPPAIQPIIQPIIQPQQPQVIVYGSNSSANAIANATTGPVYITAGSGGVQTTTNQLPKTGLPESAWLLSSLLPVGVGLKRFGNGMKPAGNIGRFLWRRREFLK